MTELTTALLAQSTCSTSIVVRNAGIGAMLREGAFVERADGLDWRIKAIHDLAVRAVRRSPGSGDVDDIGFFDTAGEEVPARLVRARLEQCNVFIVTDAIGAWSGCLVPGGNGWDLRRLGPFGIRFVTLSDPRPGGADDAEVPF